VHTKTRRGAYLAIGVALSITLAGHANARAELPEMGTSGLAADAVGAVEGTVRLEVTRPPEPPMLSPYARRRYEPPAPSNESPSSPRNVVVYVVVGGRSSPSAPADVSIVQQDQTIVPHVTAIKTGTRVHFPNRDGVFHNLFSLGEPRPFNLGRYAPGSSRSVTFEKAGVVRMFCDIHSQMGGIILVVDTPYFTQPDESGRFRIEGLPVGRHTLVAWHESAGPVSSEIVVTAGGVARADFNLPG
jgi:plastocyanin